ncbi:hypothetical protein [Massilia sp. BJB1822]|uniref:hypothetical protein n=1 Tax=Massilia sp. BJB1822 TaxID=2744470 RepID=UPI0015943A4A|nr:hypothetical protein [Massilia sp. BJB1822]NVD97943.1 hypothetical protein [Massilia sp. BJB1822]
MRQAENNRTIDLLGGFKRGKGRPSTGKAKSNAERQRNRRERLAESGFVPLTVEIPKELFDGLTKFVKFKDVTKDQVIERLLRQQLLRQR